MRLSRQRFLLLAPSALLTLQCSRTGATTGAQEQPSTDGATLLKTLRSGHPRLIAPDDVLARAKALSASDPVARQYRESIQRAGEKMLTLPPVEYKLIGPRLLDKSRTALERVYILATLYRLDGDSRWLERAKQELFTVAAFADWHPPHYLDTAEMTHAVAIGYDWLYSALTPDERKTIRAAIVEKGLRRGEEAYKGTQPWKWWVTVNHNWNLVCNGGMSLGALAVADEEPELAAFILESALKSAPRALASYAPDGGWIEGPGYWGYATQYAVAMLAGLTTALGTDFGLSDTPGFDRAGSFRTFFTGPTGKTFNYADAGEGSGDTPVLYWLSKRFQQPLYAAEAQRSAGKGGSALDLLWYEPSPSASATASLPRDTVFRRVDVAFLRSAWGDPDALWVGFKGGDNGANHAHLDLGAFVFDAMGLRWVSNLGSDNYNLPGYFGKERWNYYRLNTHGQNTLLLNGASQDIKAKAPLLAFASHADQSYAVADLTAGYAAQGATRVQRGIGLVNDRKGLLVQDEVTASAPVEYTWQIHTHAAVTVSGAEATLTQGSKTLKAYILAPEGATFAVESATPPILGDGKEPQQNANRGIQKLVAHLPKKVTDETVAILLTPEGNTKSIGLAPLAHWISSAPPLPKRGGDLST